MAKKRAYAEDVFKKISGKDPRFSLVNKQGRVAEHEQMFDGYEGKGSIDETCAWYRITLSKSWGGGVIEKAGAYEPASKENDYRNIVHTTKLKDFAAEGDYGTLRIKSAFAFSHPPGKEYDTRRDAHMIASVNAAKKIGRTRDNIKTLVESFDGLIDYFDEASEDRTAMIDKAIHTIKDAKIGRTVMEKDINKKLFNFIYHPPIWFRITCGFGHSTGGNRLDLECLADHTADMIVPLIQVQKSLWSKAFE